ncbi:ubiquitin-conjugating enzyme [Nitzschia inconspicua]|uniref:Ubiquitin-conjugating enzyme n=1 Tax=Nitzschia inconspicua TaxID=303405 RepID=A0A9K3LJZ9_9STRA|nr:ubiquitin-conjugating enzyme [Nitzschia inconspicua]
MSKSPSLRRIQADIRELSFDPSPSFHAAPLENDMFEWHFTIRGAEGTDFEGGIYHGRILLPPEYPFKPPHIIFLTPSGRFEINTKVCLSFSAYHPELWQPAWGIRLILEALISFLPTPADGAIGALDWSSKERKRLAKASQSWKCPHCGPICSLIPELKGKDGDCNNKKASSSYSKEIAELHRLQQQAEANRGGNKQQSSEERDSGENLSGGEDILQMHTPEEEIVFENDEDDIAGDTSELLDGASRDHKEGEATLEGRDSSHTGTPDISSHEVVSESQQTGTNHDVAVGASEEPVAIVPPTPLSRRYDPLLNILIVLLVAICYLLFQKWTELSHELQELEAWEYTQQLEQQNQFGFNEVAKDNAVTEL